MAFSSFASFDAGKALQPMADINTTPLVDVMLVLLVIFIITAPLFHQAVPVDLPRVDARKLADPPRVVQLALDGAGRVWVDGAPVAEGELGAILARQVATGQPAPELHLRADRATRYERVAAIMAAVQQAGIVRIAFVTEASASAPTIPTK